MDTNFEKSLGQQIRMLRKNRNMTQEQLSAKLQLRNCDITRSSLAKIEAGQRHIYADEIFHLSHVLKVSYDDIFPQSDDSES